MNSQISDFNASYGGRSAGAQQSIRQQPEPLMGNLDARGIVGMRPSTAETQMPGVSLPGAALAGMDQTPALGISSESVQFLNGFLRTQIGNRMKVEFLVGTNTYLEKSGKLVAVGANFIVLQEAMSDDLLVCDFFTIKFITIYR